MSDLHTDIGPLETTNWDSASLLPSAEPDLVLNEETVAFVETRTQAEMITEYSALVRQIAGGFQRKLPRNVLRDDLLAAGMSGLWDAVRRQLEHPSDRFDYYVRVRIRGAILDLVRSQDWAPRSAHKATRRISEAMRAVEGRTGREAGARDIAAEMGVEGQPCGG